MPLKVSVKETKEGVFLISPIGELDTTSHTELENNINPLLANARAFVFDLQGLTYISSMGLRALLRARVAMEKRGGSFLLVNPQPQVKLVLDTMQILSDSLFASLESADELLDSFLDKIQKGKITPRKPLT